MRCWSLSAKIAANTYAATAAWWCDWRQGRFVANSKMLCAQSLQVPDRHGLHTTMKRPAAFHTQAEITRPGAHKPQSKQCMQTDMEMPAGPSRTCSFRSCASICSCALCTLAPMASRHDLRVWAERRAMAAVQRCSQC